MKKFLAVFIGSADAMASWEKLSEAERNRRMKEGGAAWTAWAETNKASIVELGGPLSRTKRINAAGIADVRNHLGAFSIVQAESQEAAAKLFLNHPHFTLFAGDSVEVMEILPIPKM
jgi:hypothetical protein